MSDSLQSWRLACQACQGGRFSRQEYWSVLANTGCHTLLEHHISCCPSCQPPWVPGAARTPVTQAAAPPPHLALTGTSPSPPGQLQDDPSGRPTCRGGNRTTTETQGQCGWGRRPNLPTSSTSCRLKPHDQLGKLYVYGIYKRSLSAPTKENTLVLIAVDFGGKNTQK